MKNLLSTVLGILLVVALGYIGYGIFNPKIKEVYIQVKPKPQIIYTKDKDSTIIAKTTIIRDAKPVNVDSLKERWASVLPESEKRTEKIAELTEIKAKLEGELSSANIINEKLKSENKALEDNITVWRGKYMEISHNTADNSVKYAYDADIKMSGIKKDRTGNIMEMSLTSPDKNFKINGVETYRQSFSVPKSVFRLQAETAVNVPLKDLNASQFSVGVNAVFFGDNFISPVLGYGYFIPINGRFEPYAKAGINFNILNFRK